MNAATAAITDISQLNSDFCGDKTAISDKRCNPLGLIALPKLPQLQHIPQIRHLAPSNPPSNPSLATAVFAVFATDGSPVGSFFEHFE